ncbi:MAG: AMP-binding protein, partial [Mesorhizobium sp.]|nr:AMP-binding protein [Mesorhizobium sp.]
MSSGQSNEIFAVASMADIEAIEATPLSSRTLPQNSYDAIAATAGLMPDAPALSFFASAADFTHAHKWTYAELLADITRAANLFHVLGVTREAPVAFLLPNLPETHFTIWGGEAAGVVFAVNSMLEPGHAAELLRAAGVRVLVTLAPTSLPNDLWSRLSPHLAGLPELRTVAWVSLAPYLDAVGAPPFRHLVEQALDTAQRFELVDLRVEMNKQPADRL